MAEVSHMNEMLQNEEGDDIYKGNQNGQPSILLLRVNKLMVNHCL